jgi:hypothetical protein
MNRLARTAATCVLAFAALFCAVGFAAPQTAAPGPLPLNVNVTWGSGTHDCDSPREGSVICIAGKATIAGIGVFEYARDGVPTGATTSDGCSEYSTHGTIFVTGGTAVLDGVPATTCGGTDAPDAHYDYKITGGTGILAGATGSGDIVADHGVDKWHGTLDAAGLHPHSSSSGSSVPVIASVAGIVVLAAAVGLVFWWRRRRAGSATSST